MKTGRRAKLSLSAVILFLALALRAQAPPTGATNLWTFPFDFTLHDNASSSTPAVAPDGTIYVGSFDGKLHALSLDGKQLWRFQAGREIKSSPAIADDGTVFFVSDDGVLWAVR